jgi:hypothetical protein
MNIPAALEQAMAEAIRANATDIGAGVNIRCWQRLETDGETEGARLFPMIDIRATPPATDENQYTLYSDIQIGCGTLAQADRLHTVIRLLYAAVQEVCDMLYSDFAGVGDGSVLDAFNERVEADAAGYTFGGLSFQAGSPPLDDKGINTIGVALRVHYSRNW